MTYRAAQADEMNKIYMMGYGAWSDGNPVEEYLKQCRESPKYKRGTWFVLNVRSALVASLIVYSFEGWADLRVRGIGSVATDPSFRNMGYGHQIVRSATDMLVDRESAGIVFLYSDIGSSFYEAVGYTPLAASYQKTPGSTLMARMHPRFDAGILEQNKDRVPSYF